MGKGKKNNNVRKSGYFFEYRFTFLGDKQTGKTSVMNRFISNTFTHRYRPTIEDHVTHTIEHNGNICVCLMVDTCGGNDFPAMRRLNISKGNAFFLCYSINSRKTFEETKRIADEIISLKGSTEDVKIMVIGNKADLADEREVLRTEGEKLVNILNTGNVSSIFFEVSARDNSGISDILTSLLNMFIPEQSSEVCEIPEKSAFSRMSLRKRKAKRSIHKKKTLQVPENQKPSVQNDLMYYSDTEAIPGDTLGKTEVSGKLVRSSSADLLNGSDSGLETTPDSSPVFSRRESSAKDILRKTFGSMQKLFIKPPESHNGEPIKRSNTADITRGKIVKQATQ